MIGRAIFWIGFVWLLMPHEPDVGLGSPSDARPDSGQSIAAYADTTADWLNRRCVKDGSTCSRASRFLAAVAHQARTQTLAQVKAEIDASIRARDLLQKRRARDSSGNSPVSRRS